jgi:hypothetical protein
LTKAARKLDISGGSREMAVERVRKRLGFLEGVELSVADFESVVAELETYDQALAEVERFAEGVSWIDLPTPRAAEARHG